MTREEAIQKLTPFIPYKIYVPQHNIEAGNIQELNELIVAGSTEYIRKDALLDWAKEQASITEKLNGKGAMLKAWDSLIDKIESL